uniref:Uncharacterized protein n=1 Tax=Anguilla anguilla TaxID=7936 RepID=A0A0E9U5K0_ANGAN
MSPDRSCHQFFAKCR